MVDGRRRGAGHRMTAISTMIAAGLAAAAARMRASLMVPPQLAVACARNRLMIKAKSAGVAMDCLPLHSLGAGFWHPVYLQCLLSAECPQRSPRSSAGNGGGP